MVQGLKALGKYKTVLFCFFDLFFLIFFIFIDWSMVSGPKGTWRGGAKPHGG